MTSIRAKACHTCAHQLIFHLTAETTSGFKNRYRRKTWKLSLPRVRTRASSGRQKMAWRFRTIRGVDQTSKSPTTIKTWPKLVWEGSSSRARATQSSTTIATLQRRQSFGQLSAKSPTNHSTWALRSKIVWRSNLPWESSRSCTSWIPRMSSRMRRDRTLSVCRSRVLTPMTKGTNAVPSKHR